MSTAQIAIIGGSGLYDLQGLTNINEIDMQTPFGKPSDTIVTGELGGKKVAFLPRHGRGHRIPPTSLPVRANIYALKTLGVEKIISVSAVGSLREEFKPLDMVVPHQLIDRTYSRTQSFFENGPTVHISFSDPYCPSLSQLLFQTASSLHSKTHEGGTMVVMEGPAFSTKAESHMYRTWGGDIIGMTALPEAKLAREAEICYSTLACVTDYDCWRDSTEVVSVDMVVANLNKNVETAKRIVETIVAKIPMGRNCDCENALKDSILTARNSVDSKALEKLGLIISKYM
ncbi:S-methyl-5'-thioadenosine phosphorylase [SAR202 cluster bacterium AC-409-J13_OGT_754m]|nr:S-methyl-5'-thioadenosine phosphorylase [SAR202 cluster bacterium AC-409-J13_OGT_754m]